MSVQANIFLSGESMNSPSRLMLSLVPFCYIIMMTSQLVVSSPMRAAKSETREDHHLYDDNFNTIYDSIPSRSSKDAIGLKLIQLATPKNVKSWLHSLPLSFDPPVPAYSAPKLIYKELFYNKRRKRELRTARKIPSASSYSASKSSYFPFLMAEMIPGSVKTRHPSIIAVNGCPAYYIADHKGQCRQVFQYTVNFGQRSPKSYEPTPPQQHTVHSVIYNEQPQHISLSSQSPQITPTSTEAPVNIEITGKPVPAPVYTPSRPTPSPRLLMLLRNAAKRFDLSFLKNHSSTNSGETVINEDGIEKLRRKILSALKITKNKDYGKIEEKQKPEKTVVILDTKSTTPDYDD